MGAKIIEAILGPITSFIGAIPGYISTAVNGFLFTGTGETKELSAFAYLVFTFLGISLAFGLTKLVFHLVKRG